RLGSGSAPRSLLGGFVEMQAGVRDDGADAVPVQLLREGAWPLAVLVAVTALGRKEVGSTFGMELSAQTSPFYRPWLSSVADDLEAARAALGERDVQRLGEVAEHNCLKMHAVALAAQPGLIYWNAATVEVIHVVRSLRVHGGSPFFTIDAGPQVKVFCRPEEATGVSEALAKTPGVHEVLHVGVGEAAHIVEAH
ncbi:MAG: diphosphomevalonate decarboxylase, partial [Deltaproteobacteria bacterium]|nr:diphosphomevalonate decarboxylase [Deltaproteobacteria bacterium]